MSDQHECQIFIRSLTYTLARQTPPWASVAFASSLETRNPVMRLHPLLSKFFPGLHLCLFVERYRAGNHETHRNIHTKF